MAQNVFRSRDDFTPESDVDVLVESEPGRTPSDLGKYYRDEVLAEAMAVYAAA